MHNITRELDSAEEEEGFSTLAPLPRFGDSELLCMAMWCCADFVTHKDSLQIEFYDLRKCTCNSL
jgi:hypothetical protein